MTDAPAMTSHRPYLLRALYEWIADNGLTPHLLVDATRPGVRVPTHAVKDGRIVLNIAERAVAHLQMDNDDVRFSARFGGVSHAVIVPIDAVVAIYARENGQGMELPPDIAAQGSASPAQSVESASESDDTSPDDEPPHSEPPPKRGGHLRIVK
ncbi:ClpXP protease specificity-enhancing factor [Pseudoluteimonas lycopersici]|nr:ClpXP protease specificity-enhancing factor [Lysobacter lycopersici]